jgi:hypothetical protein
VPIVTYSINKQGRRRLSRTRTLPRLAEKGKRRLCPRRPLLPISGPLLVLPSATDFVDFLLSAGFPPCIHSFTNTLSHSHTTTPTTTRTQKPYSHPSSIPPPLSQERGSIPPLTRSALNSLITPHPSNVDTMGHEDAVYLAKLAEQAERYEGMYNLQPPAYAFGVSACLWMMRAWPRQTANASP